MSPSSPVSTLEMPAGKDSNLVAQVQQGLRQFPHSPFRTRIHEFFKHGFRVDVMAMLISKYVFLIMVWGFCDLYKRKKH